MATIAGWGQLSEGGSFPTKLQDAQIPIQSDDTCSNDYADGVANGNTGDTFYYNSDVQLCAGPEEGGVATCHGDSGGPLMVNNGQGGWLLVGVTNWAYGCARPNQPTVFAKIADGDLQTWVHDAIDELLPPAERVSISWDTANDVDLHVWDASRNHAYYDHEQDAIPGAMLSPDVLQGEAPEVFWINSRQQQPLALGLCYYGEDGQGPTTVTVTITDPNGAQRVLTRRLYNEGDSAIIGSSPGGALPSAPVDFCGAPRIAIGARPVSQTRDTTAAFTFASSLQGAAFECHMATGNWSPCQSGVRYDHLSEGPHSFAVRQNGAPPGSQPFSPWPNATDATVYRWTVDRTPPHMTITRGPTQRTKSTTGLFRFAASERATFECRIDGHSFRSCRTPAIYRHLARSKHTFQVRARDAAGNQSAAAQRSWTIVR
jgi:hypothetical protein